MKFSVENKDLSKALSSVLRAISPKTNQSALQCVYIKTAEGSIELTASDTELTVITRIPAVIYQNGSVIIPAKTFSDLIRTYPDEKVNFEVNEKSVVNIKCSTSEVDINGQDESVYPQIATLKQEHAVYIGRDTFLALIKDTVFATAGPVTINPILTGVFMEFKDKELSFTALDGYKLAHHTEVLTECESDDFEAVIPARTLNEVMKILLAYDDDAKLYFENRKLSVNIGEHTQIISNLLEGTFINYRNLIPTQVNTVVKINRDELLTRVERASIIMDATRNSLIKMDYENDILTIKSESEQAKVNEQIKVYMNGDMLKIAFNARYYIEILKNISDENIIIEFRDKNGPCVIKPAIGERYMYLIMPVRYMD